MTESGISQRALGVFPADNLFEAKAFDRWLDGKLSVVTTFVPVDVSQTVREQFVGEYLTTLWEAGFVPIVTLEPWSFEEIPSYKLLNGSDEIYEQFQAWATQFANWMKPSSPDRKVILRPAHEMNGTWYPWSIGAGLDPADYRRMWRTIYDIFREEGLIGDRVRWVWSINSETTADLNLAAVYPGDAYIDWVGVDGYNFGESQNWSSWVDPTSIFESTFEQVRDISGAPLSVPEFGCSSIRDGTPDQAAKAAWIMNVFDLFDTWNIRLASWFNVDKETDWRVLDVAASAGNRYPDTVQINGTKFAVYPSFRQAAIQYLD